MGKVRRFIHLGEDRCSIQTPLICYLHELEESPFIIGEYVCVPCPVKWALESYVGVGFPNGK